MSRAEFALALAVEAVLEHEGPVRGHAPLLAHLALLQVRWALPSSRHSAAPCMPHASSVTRAGSFSVTGSEG